jgi:hypothetical protein
MAKKKPPQDMHARWLAVTKEITAKKKKVRKAEEHMTKWAMVAKLHHDKGQNRLAAEALKKAEFWEARLKKLKG